ncbi:SDR family oxidoreductase [Aggregatimonas sangjinii]|uniref:SDR family oxidoreductase n=1 Tax=Aggregatimonas sangjinii TaxID=2583587 RepID=A0A5B7ST07_9FLAO|nr:NAD(P)-binding oxidoreductase [Aggregatimonas sangjinii]QCX01667.1 SDR family oxidoreductase [Aggregatimonas sangjinii]
MRILVLGATGRTGKRIVAYALAQGYQVNCLVRDVDRIAAKPNLNRIEGSTTITTDVQHALQGCSAIVSALNISRTSDFPFAPLRTPKEFLSKTMANVISVANKNGIKRIVSCSAWGVADTRKDIPFWFRWMIDFSNIKYAYRDHERQEALLEKSAMEWTIVRPVGLTNGRKDQKIIESIQNFPKPDC